MAGVAMKFGDVLADSVYGTTGHLAAASDLDRLAAVIEHNLEVLRTFGSIVVATNYGPPVYDSAATQTAADIADIPTLRRANLDLWRSYFPDCVLLDSPINRGHSIGTADLDSMLFNWCKSTGERWLCKSANDITLAPRVLDIPVTDAQFYFINAISYDAIAQHPLDPAASQHPPDDAAADTSTIPQVAAARFDLAQFEGDFFYPQDTFWAMDTMAADTLVDASFLDASWRVVSRIPDYNGRIWEHLRGWSCEQLLANAVRRNGLTRCSLLTPEQWRAVLDLTVAERITDCSLKGIEVNGICHTQGLAEITQPDAVIR